ncbi:hypothetical protein BKA80DRAFT_72232 [Phyllosticta citrichinensis]
MLLQPEGDMEILWEVEGTPAVLGWHHAATGSSMYLGHLGDVRKGTGGIELGFWIGHVAGDVSGKVAYVLRSKLGRWEKIRKKCLWCCLCLKQKFKSKTRTPLVAPWVTMSLVRSIQRASVSRSTPPRMPSCLCPADSRRSHWPIRRDNWSSYFRA